MKYLTCLGMLMLSACVTHHPKNITVIMPPVAGTTLSSNEIESIRSGEVVKKYYVGAYVDPTHPQVRHDPHMVERIEQDSRWNLRPNAPVVASGPTYKAVEENALKNAMQMQHDYQLNQQKSSNTAVQAQTAGLREEINALKAKLNTQDAAADLKKLEEKIESLSSKVDSMESSKTNAEPLVNQAALSKMTNNISQQSVTPWERSIQGE